ncbi:gp61-like protein [Phenacoccus solenopsis nudivirus]|nr:gp61-like protein [Phenacoccus solenopsis nudivirus]
MLWTSQCVDRTTNMNQSNKTRFIYTISDSINSEYSCRLISNGLYFSRETKSDEKIVITERVMFSIVRTLLFLFASNLDFEGDVESIIETGKIQYTYVNSTDLKFTHSLDLECCIRFFDSLFGVNFSYVVNRPLSLVYSEYQQKWRYYDYGADVLLPSILDIVIVYRFYNLINYKLNASALFLLDKDHCDHRIPLQSKIKRITG